VAHTFLECIRNLSLSNSNVAFVLAPIQNAKV
jgi:hypothetical protein